LRYQPVYLGCYLRKKPPHNPALSGLAFGSVNRNSFSHTPISDHPKMGKILGKAGKVDVRIINSQAAELETK